MIKNQVRVFGDVITSNTPVYTAPDFNSVLGLWDKMAIQVVVDNVGGSDPRLSVAIQESNDGRNWSERAKPLDGVSISDTATNNFIFADTGSTPAMALIRFEIEVDSRAGTPKGHVCVTVCQRDNS